MGKDKLRRFAENLTFECFVQPAFEEAFRRDHPLKGHWHSDFFHNDRPIVLELGCGKGEYHTGGFYKPFRLWLPVKPTVKPAIQRVKIFSFYLAITENPMGNRILQCIQHRLRRLKIHIRHPQWQHIYVTSAFHGEIIFQAVCLFPVNFPVKIIGCHF